MKNYCQQCGKLISKNNYYTFLNKNLRGVLVYLCDTCGSSREKNFDYNEDYLCMHIRG